MHKGQACSFGFDLWTKSGELGDRLAAKRSTEMAQKYEENRMVDREVFDDISALRTIGFQELRIYALCLEHGKLIFTDSGSRSNRFRGCAMADLAPEFRRLTCTWTNYSTGLANDFLSVQSIRGSSLSCK
jgi:hypothetical protein